uniref:DUF4203 domain-containing protein n=1 Tax=Panagrolaimus sp. JU765 TaxID=591449 RepID=A0AC34QBG4_9BILA
MADLELASQFATRRLVSFIFSILALTAVIVFLLYRLISYKRFNYFTFLDAILLGGAAICAILAIFLRIYWIYLASLTLLTAYGLAAIILGWFTMKVGSTTYKDVAHGQDISEREKRLLDDLPGFGFTVALFGFTVCYVPGFIIYLYNFIYDRRMKLRMIADGVRTTATNTTTNPIHTAVSYV